jgi:hypothetical protein
MVNNAHKYWLRLVAAAILSAAVGATGCAEAGLDSESGPQTEADGGVEPDAGGDEDTGADEDTGGDPDTGGDEDTGDPEPVSMVPSLAPSAGGAAVETPNHKIRLIVAPRGGAETVETSSHRIRMGAGNLQHGQQ